MSTVQTVETTIPKQGLTMVITGNGKGKTTSAFGQALRAIGHGQKVCIIQFMKGMKYGEISAAEKYLPDITIIQAGLDSFVMRDNPAPVDIDLARQGMDRAREVIQSKKYNMVILDEINIAVNFNLISEDTVIDLIQKKPPELNLILTGRYASANIKDIADMVSEIAEIKHHYNAGVKGQAGIEF